MEKYTKVALTIDEQIELLEGRGLDIPDTDRTARHLSNISYYRMSAYMIPFRQSRRCNYLYKYLLISAN